MSNMKTKALKTIVSAFLALMLCLSLFPTIAHASVAVNINPVVFEVGVAQTTAEAVLTFSTGIRASITSGTIPAGVTVQDIGMYGLCFTGTAQPGTVGSDTITYSDGGGGTATATFTVTKGPQTIAVDYDGSTDITDIYVPVGANAFTLDAYSKNGNGDRLGIGAWTTDAPTLTFALGSGTATVNASGLVTPGAAGDTTINIGAAATASYETAVQKTITIHVLALNTTPAAAIDYIAEKLTGLTANSDYTVDGGGETADGSGNIAIDEGWMDGASYSIVHKGDGTTVLDSLPQNLIIPARPAAPGGLFAINATTAGGNGGISGTTTDMEYSNSATGPWTDCTAGSTTNLAQGTYYVRTKAVANTSFASEQAAVTIADATDKDITAFFIGGVNGVINGTDITVTMPYGTNKANLTPTITHTGASVSPASGAAQDFTNPVTYTVTAQDGSTQVYTVTVRVQPPPSPLPKTGDGFPLYALLALLGGCLVALGWLGLQMRKRKPQA